MSTTINISQLASTSLDYAREHLDDVFTEALAPGLDGIAGTPVKPLDYYARSIPGYDEVVLTQVNVTAEIRPSTYDGFEPKVGEAAKISPRVAKVQPIKLDVLFTQQQIIALWKTYYGMKKSKKIDPQTFPFEQFIVKTLTKRVQSDLRKKSLFNAVRNDAGKTALEVFDGLFKKTNDYVTSGLIPTGNVVGIEALTPSNAVEQFEKVLDSLPSEHFYDDLIFLVPRQFKRFYEQDYRKRYGTVPYNLGFDKQEIEGSSVEFCVEPGMATSGDTAFDMGVLTKKNNIVWMYDDESAFRGFEVDYSKRDRSLAFMMDFQANVDIAMTTEVWLPQVA